jgi:hypothetical protein
MLKRIKKFMATSRVGSVISPPRALHEPERQYQFKPEQKFEFEPDPSLDVIQMNSTFMELTDWHYHERGFVTCGGLVFAGIALYALVGNTQATYEQYAKNILDVAGIVLTLMVYLVFGFLFWLCTLIARAELGRWTHYPIRLNRKTGAIYVFGYNGEVRKFHWRELFFTLNQTHFKGNYALTAHKLNAQGEVEYSFWLPFEGDLPPEGQYQPEQVLGLKHHWEFLRRYMDEGPASVSRYVKRLMPLQDQQREPVLWSYYRLSAHYGPLGFLMAPLNLILWPFRVLVMKTGKVPVWPQWVEDECVIEPNDPYRLDKDHPPKGK